MPVEVAKLVNDFNKLWPRGTDPVSKADDHIRMIKEVLQLEFELLYNKTRVFSFEKGAVVNPDCILYYEAEKAFYQWNGAYDVNNKYIVNAGSTPTTAGGIGGNAWTRSTGSGFMSTVLVSDTEPTAPFQNMLWWDTNSGTFFIYYNDGTSAQWVDLFGIADQASFNTLLFRSILARLAAESGYTLVGGSFQEGAISSGSSDVVLDWNTAKFYQWHLNENKVVPAGSTPATTGGIGAGAWVDRTDVVLRDQLAESTGATKVGTSDGRTVEQRLAALPNEVETALAASAYIKDASRHAVERASGGRQTVLYDDLGNPSIMNIIPIFRYEDLGYSDDMGTGVVSCFDVGTGTNKSEIFIGAFQSSLVGSRAVSLPRENPATSVNFDTAKGYCANKGAGWHLMTMHEWAAISLWCMANGFEPRGNTNYGRAIDRYVELGRRVDGGLPGVNSGTTRVHTGSGPDAWRHNNSPWGISDLVGNVWEWIDGFKLQDGQTIASTFNTQAEASWVAQAAYFDSTLTTGGAPRLSNAVVNRLGTIGNNMDSGYIAAADFKSIAKTGTYVSNRQLKRLLVEPSTVLPKGRVPMRNFGERLPCRGGSIGTGAGLAALDLKNSRVFTDDDIGFRLAFA